MQKIFVASSIVDVELTEEEVKLVLKHREKKKHQALRDSYINEMKDLLARAKADGFTFGCKTNVWSISNAEPWNDAEDRWINLIR